MWNKVDVIIPVYNGEQFIQECLNSVFNQTYPVCHVIVVDDGSTDGTKELLRLEMLKRENLRVIFGEHRGVSEARNLGLEVVDADFVALLDSDDFWLKDKIANQFQALKDSGKSFVGIASQYFILSEDGLTGDNSRCGVVTRKELVTFESVLPGSSSSVLIHMKSVPEILKFDSSLKFGEDLDFWIQCAKYGDWYVTDSRDVVIRSNLEGTQVKLRLYPKLILNSMRLVMEKNRLLLNPLRFFLSDGYLLCIFLKGVLVNRQRIGLDDVTKDAPLFVLKIASGLSYFIYLKLRFLVRSVQGFKFSTRKHK